MLSDKTPTFVYNSRDPRTGIRTLKFKKRSKLLMFRKLLTKIKLFVKKLFMRKCKTGTWHWKTERICNCRFRNGYGVKMNLKTGEEWYVEPPNAVNKPDITNECDFIKIR